MSANNSRQSYEDCYELMDSALESSIGVRIGFDKVGEAKHYRMRLHYARTLDQQFNMNRYEGADPRRGKSEYDMLRTRLVHTEGKHWVYVEKRKAPTVVEIIKEGKDADTISPIRTFRRA